MRRSWAIPQQCIYRNANAGERLATRFVRSALYHVSPMDYLQPCGGPGGHLWFHRPLTLADTHFAETCFSRARSNIFNEGSMPTTSALKKKARASENRPVPRPKTSILLTSRPLR